MARLTGNWQLSLLHPVLESIGICEGVLWLLEPVVLTPKWWIWGRHELVFLQGWGGWWCGMVVFHPHCMTLCLRQFKWHSHLPCELLVVILARNFLQLPPPVWCYLPAECIMISTWFLPWGGPWVMGYHSWQEAVIHFCICKGHLLPTRELLKVGLQQWGYSNSFPPLLLINWSQPSSCPQSTRSAGVSGSPCPPQHLPQGCHLRKGGPPCGKGHAPLVG